MIYGVVGNLNEDRRYGRIIAADGTNLPFLYDDYGGGRGEVPTIWQPVQFEVAPHPWEPNRQVAKNVCPAGEFPSLAGRVSVVRGTHGFVSVRNGEGVFFFTQMTPDLNVGDAVTCVVVPGRDGHLFALSITKAEGHVDHPRLARAQDRAVPTRVAKPTAPKGPTVAAATKIGTRHGKDVNDDAFLVQPVLGGEVWLLVIADGISRPENGWWASDKCMELIWRSLPDIEQRLVQSKDCEQQIVSEWLYRLNREFLRERSSQAPDFQQSSSTLTMAMVRGRDVFCAHCGDSRLYILDPSKEPRYRLKGAFSDDLDSQRGMTQYRKVGLSSHIAAKGTAWNPLSDHLVIPRGGVLLLCSDGVVARDGELPKSRELMTLLSTNSDLQSMVAAVLYRIRTAGETDDLTLIAFKPEK